MSYYIEETKPGQGSRLYTKAGVLPFILTEEANLLATKLNHLAGKKMEALIAEINLRNETEEGVPAETESLEDPNQETAILFADNFIGPSGNWIRKIIPFKSRLDRLIVAEKIPKEYLAEASKAPEPNNSLKFFIDKFQHKFPNFRMNDWKNILAVEPVRKKTIAKYPKSYFSYFVGNINKGETSILDVAKREVKEEGSVAFSEEIYSVNYQNSIRRKYGLFKEHYLEFPFFDKSSGTTYFTRIYLLFMEKIKISEFPLVDENQNEYYFVNV